MNGRKVSQNLKIPMKFLSFRQFKSTVEQHIKLNFFPHRARNGTQGLTDASAHSEPHIPSP
jgi:hypothetical protein